MTVKAFADELGFTALSLPCPDREVSGAYIGDLLSWVMGRAEAGNVWITIMSNQNIAAVATLADVACILLAEEVIPDAEVLRIAEEKGINILATKLSAFEAAKRISAYV